MHVQEALGMRALSLLNIFCIKFRILPKKIKRKHCGAGKFSWEFIYVELNELTLSYMWCLAPLFIMHTRDPNWHFTKLHHRSGRYVINDVSCITKTSHNWVCVQVSGYVSCFYSAFVVNSILFWMYIQNLSLTYYSKITT